MPVDMDMWWTMFEGRDKVQRVSYTASLRSGSYYQVELQNIIDQRAQYNSTFCILELRLFQYERIFGPGWESVLRFHGHRRLYQHVGSQPASYASLLANTRHHYPG
jgi:hypothetical protein